MAKATAKDKAPLTPEAKAQKDFKKIESTLKTTLENMKDEELKNKAAEVALYRSTRAQALKNDPEIKQLASKLSLEKKDYNDEIKGADLQIRYIQFLLENRGKA